MSKQNSYRRLTDFIASPKFFWAIIVLLVLQSAWIACSGRYPMAFDEDFHLGVIRLYAHHISPFWSAHPAGADQFGAVARDPSYLYHWLMSFPYRLINTFTHDQAIQVLWLRAINIGLFAAGLALYRKLLLKTGASRTVVHSVLLVFVLIPVVPLLAAQINYDNLFLPLTVFIFLLVISFNQKLTRKKQINGPLLLAILILSLLVSLVKYAFLPIFAAVVIYMIVRLWQVFGSAGGVWQAKRAALKRLRNRTGLLLVLGLILSAGLFIERYGVNMIRYHNPVPDCGKVLTIDACSAYGPWDRDYNLELQKDPHASKNPFAFAGDWFYGMWLRLLFSVDGPGTQFQTKGPLIIPALTVIIFTVTGTILSLIYGVRLFRRYDAAVLSLLLAVAAIYIGALWLDGYRAFLRTGLAVAINGRYLLPVLPPLMLMAALAFNELLKRRENLKLLIGIVAVIGMLWGGGALTYILRSGQVWYWSDPAVRSANEHIQRVLGPVIPGYDDPIAFMHHRY